MTADKRTVATDALETLGTVIGEGEKRDAIHLAVVPMIASACMLPGKHVDQNGRATGIGRGVGIVDPFLSKPIEHGESFWLVIYPRQITSLRHEWTHPAFGEQAAQAHPHRSTSEAWMRKWAVEHVSDDYYGDVGGKVSEESAYAYAIEAGRKQHIGPYEDARDHIDSEWWDHWEAITGQRGQRGAYFSCSC